MYVSSAGEVSTADFFSNSFFVEELSLFLFLDLKPVMITVRSDDDLSLSRYPTD